MTETLTPVMADPPGTIRRDLCEPILVKLLKEWEDAARAAQTAGMLLRCDLEREAAVRQEDEARWGTYSQDGYLLGNGDPYHQPYADPYAEPHPRTPYAEEPTGVLEPLPFAGLRPRYGHLRAAG
jgi:hypothetical protein